MTRKKIAALLRAIDQWPTIFFSKKKYILIVSHMRSRSSLLSHIFISGYAEISQAYHSFRDFLGLRYEVWSSNNHSLQGDYVLDKVLHNRYCIADSVLLSPSVYICYLLRRPEDSIRSIMQLVKMHPGASVWQSPERASRYYQARISQMARYGKKDSHQSFFIESDDLIDKTEMALGSISNWLALDEPLRSSYFLFERPGEPGYGDPSKAILAGMVISNKDSYEDIYLSPGLIEKTRESYERAKRI